ncbi:MAG TPA: succinate dehydrogenase/fumarate reductase iron-sulfur subunit [Tenuifilaceae bacterium]|nr:succinate dehydrogenase/fumarate reductase iron-sulfur subunit [Tenuifilaceae bacterium]HPE19193.1 succinate dehydrogenase/fumarate reductase iron-sulfur subunit [Tenuifilaceae bacterium]HPJ45740.1 succinate dehydrogenase/fumarate reductase iron-sulfur subunit [Tenuifilaceae bacterium]HPQ33699.1 succinate dehydrogenase/fumarate reductase iron-sulfur subunit [Tenuifilaceae bacterium]HRX68879.1 succinate dehydrogenase/fumarate reductase iron-sulfur subunit [Tenuifilaceae bacterium]
MDITLKIWRQKDAKSKGRFETYPLSNVSPEMSFLEMLDYLNSQLILKGDDPVTFEHDCREGICGCCGLYINGRPHGLHGKTTTCELHLRDFKDGNTITIEPWRAAAFPVIKDLMVDRNAFEKIMQAGGFISINTGAAPDANSTPVSKANFDEAFDAASCIGCGACVAACKNSSAMLFISAKVSQLALLPQGRAEAKERVKKMIAKMDELGFGGCSNTRACEAECPKGISITHIARLNREFIAAKVQD